MTAFLRRILLFVFVSGVLAGCSQYSTNKGAVGFHNFSARYNAYFMGDKDLAAAEFGMDSVFKEDYNQLLPILMPLDSVLAAPFKILLTSAIRKSSIVAEKHQNSRWVDNSYYILGKSRLYLGEWADGLEALRYVYANGRDDEDKNHALILLMHAYAYKKDYANALGVAEHLSQQPLSKQLTREFYLTKAFVHQQNGEYLTSVAILEETFPLLKKSKGTARLHYAAGQMYDRLGQYALANKHYKSVSKNKPNYDLAFYASMSALQNAVILDPKRDISAVGFEKMLRDRKNVDLKDRVYFTMGLLEEHRKNLPKAVEDLQKSVAATSGNGAQKAYTYLQLARIHYDGLESYDLAKSYYDSALAVLPKTAAEYVLVSDRKRALDSFVTQHTIVTREDSLQKLAKMNPLALDNKIDGIIEAQEKERLEQEKKAKALAAAAANASGNARNAAPTGFGVDRRWELYDPVLLSSGKIEFKRIWGNRPLEDDWRRSGKQSRALATGNKLVADSSAAAPGVAVAATLTKGSEAWNNLHAELKKNVPLADTSMVKSQKLKEDALYSLGKIYRFDLKEPQRAISTFDRLLTEFPKTTYKDELYYLMYLTLPEDQAGRTAWRDKLLAEFPNSTYARLVTKAAATTSDERGNPVKAYERVYKMYEEGNFTKALEDVESDLPMYKGTMLEDKFALLRVFLIGHVRGKDAYTQSIAEFIRLYPSSIYLPRLKEMQQMNTLSMGNR